MLKPLKHNSLATKSLSKERHYKKSRFGASEKELSEFKKKNITIDLDEVKNIVIENLKSQTQILKHQNENIIIPKKNSCVQILTQKQLNAFTIILKFIKEFGFIDFLQISTYTIDQKTLYTLKELSDNRSIGKIQIIMTETASFRIPKIYKLLKENFSNNPNVNLAFYWLHNKNHLIKIGENKFCIDGSGNFSQNAQVEHYNIFNSEKLFDFQYNFANDFFFSEKLRKSHEIFKNF